MRSAWRGWWLAAFLAAAGCWTPRQESPLDEALRQIGSSETEERERAFSLLARAGAPAALRLKSVLGASPEEGYPVVALLYADGEGDAVPIDLRARHLAIFRWPAALDAENAVLEPYVWNELERDLVKSGRPSLQLLADALGRAAPTEAKALQVVRVMLRIGGRAAAEEFARLLDEDRDLGGVRVNAVAAGALLYLGRQELALRTADRDALVEAARRWWADAKGRTEAEWTRQAVAALAERWEPGDREGVRSVLELLVGRTIESPGEWWKENREWWPPYDPVRPDEIVPLLSRGRPEAYAANHRLETATGACLNQPRMERLGELCSALRLWEPAPDLAVRWKRYLSGTFLRISISVLGPVPDAGAPLRGMAEKRFHSTEDQTVYLMPTAGDEEQALVYVQSRDFGTRIVCSEGLRGSNSLQGRSSEHSGLETAMIFSPLLRACIVIAVSEAPGRLPPRPAEAIYQETRRRLRALADSADERARREALRALGYCQDAADLEYFKERKAGEALLLLGDPAALEYSPKLEPHEIEMALSKAEDPDVKDYLDALRRAGN